MQNDFSIEVPGESNPLTEGILLHVLKSAASTNPQQIQTGTKQLQQWEKAPSYYTHLQSVFLTKNLPFEVRSLAIIQLKNGIDKYWRKTATNAVSKEDRAIIRSRLLQGGLNEYDHRLALQNALVVAKIVRFEYPNDWPDAISTMIDALRSASQLAADPIQLPRALLLLLHVTKELATGRLSRTRQALQAATPEIVRVLGRIYIETVQSWQSSLSNDSGDPNELVQSMQSSLLAIKTLRRLFIAGYEFPNRDSDVHEFWQITSDQVGLIINVLSTRSNTLSLGVSQMIEKHLLQLSKLHLEMAKTHPGAFVLLPRSLELVQAYWSLIKQYGDHFGTRTAVVNVTIGNVGDQVEDKPFMEKITLKGILLIRACIKLVFNPSQTFKYRHDQEKVEKADATKMIQEQLLTHSFVQELMEVVVTKFFVFRDVDLREWEEDPEEWEQTMDSEAEGFEFSVRPCAEKLFLDLALNYRELLLQPLLSVFNSVATPDNENILFKDSVYTAIGLAAAVIHQELDFDAFLSSTLVTEVQKQSPGYNLLRRRIAILLGQWITIKISDENKPLVYKIFQHLLDNGDTCNDQVVRITAGRQFKNIVDDWHFKPEQFLPYADLTMTRLMELIQEVELTETKLALVNTISILVERLEHHIAPYVNSIITLLPPLWEQSGEEHLMKQAIVTVFARLVTSMKAASVPIHSLILPIIKSAVEPGSETGLYLIDDAIDLWYNILYQSPTPASPELLSLAPYLFPLYETASELFRTALEITQSYYLIAPSDMLSDQMRKPLFAALTPMLGTLKPDANGVVNNLVEIVVRAAEGVGGEEAVRTVTGDLVESGFLGKQLGGLHGSWLAHCTVGHRTKESPVDGIVETDYFSVLARIIMGCDSAFYQAVQAAAPATNADSSLEKSMKWILEEWFSHFENIGDPSRRKLMCLALTKLLASQQPFIMLSLQSLMTMWTDVVSELREGGDAQDWDSLVFEDPSTLEPQDPSVPEAPEEERRRVLSCSDPVHTVKTSLWIKHYLQQAIQGCGGQEVFQDEWLVNVDKDVVAAFSGLGIM